MTALPTQDEFATTSGANGQNGSMMHPDVHDKFWGYEVRMIETGRFRVRAVRTLAAVGAVAFSTIGLGAIMWAVRAGETGTSKPYVFYSLLFLALGFLTAHVFSQFRDVRVQVDTQAGELREVAPTITSIDVVASTENPEFGQIHVEIEGAGIVPVGDGAVSSLRLLRNRLALDCGLDVVQGDDAMTTEFLD